MDDQKAYVDEKEFEEIEAEEGLIIEKVEEPEGQSAPVGGLRRSNGVDNGRNESPRKRGGWFTAAVVLSVIASFALLIGAYFFLVLPSRLPWGEDGVFTLLVVGTDVDYVAPKTRAEVSVGRADTVMLLIMPRKGQTATVMSIPRDTLVQVNGNYNRVRFNSLYKGLPPDELIEGVKSLADLEVDRWVRVDFDAFTGFVDALGGIEVDVEKRMWYVDRAGGYSLDLQPGKQVLDGKTSLAYVRYRQDALGDIARVSRQQDFVLALAKSTIKLSTLGKIGDFRAIVDKYVQNDMNLYEYAAIGIRALKIGPSNIDTRTLPGNFSGPYWEADEEAIAKLLEQIEGGGTK